MLPLFLPNTRIAFYNIIGLRCFIKDIEITCLYLITISLHTQNCFFGFLQDGTLAGTTTNEDTSTAKGSSGAVNPEVGKDELVKAALDKLKESKKSDDEGKGTMNGSETREEPEAKLASDTKTEIGGERMKERERDRERERTRGRDYDRGRESDRERGREDYERGRDKVKERVHRSRDKGKDSGQLI